MVIAALELFEPPAEEASAAEPPPIVDDIAFESSVEVTGPVEAMEFADGFAEGAVGGVTGVVAAPIVGALPEFDEEPEPVELGMG